MAVSASASSIKDRKNHPLLQECREFENVHLRCAPLSVQKLYEFHFLVMDSDCYRFERDKHRPNAVASFGHEEGAQNLKRIFETLWKRCNPIEVYS